MYIEAFKKHYIERAVGGVQYVNDVINGILLQLEAVFAYLQGKAVPLHAMKTLGWREGIIPTHSRHRHQMVVGDERHTLAAL
jgi:hypothetical protein